MPRAAVGGTVVPIATVGNLVSSPSIPTSSYINNQVSFMSSPSSEDQISTQGIVLIDRIYQNTQTFFVLIAKKYDKNHKIS